MDPRLWSRAKRVFGEAMALPEQERGAFLRRTCAGNEKLEDLVERLVAADRDFEPKATPRLHEPDTLLADHYRILGPVGQGGMGIVYAAQDVLLQRRVAIKFLPPELSRDPTARDRFRREARAASALDHPNICSIYEIDETDDGQTFIVMAYYDGQTLANRIESGALSSAEAVDICIDIAEGLERAHAAGIFHRDIKPANVMITQFGEVKILDFGLAKVASQHSLSRQGQVMGTVAYMSPEQLRGEEVDHRTDIWSLGVTLFESLTGRLPFAGERHESMMRAILQDEPKPLPAPPPNLPQGLAPILDRMMAKKPSERYSGVRLVNEALRRIAGRSEVGPPSGQVGGAATAVRNRSRWAVAALALTMILTSVAVWIASRGVDGEHRVIKSLVVLPLENLSQDPAQTYFVDGITEALIAEMGRIRELRVISRTSAMAYRDSDLRLSEIARDLNVDGVIEGALLKVGDQIQISTRLLRAEPEELLWDRTYQRDLGDVLGIMASIAKDVASEVRIVLSPDEETRLQESREVDPRAHDLYLRGRYIWLQSGIKGGPEARSLFEQAIAIDPEYAAPYSGLADVYPQFYSHGEMTRREAYTRAREYARTAIDLDPDLAEAYASLVRISIVYDWNWEAGERYVKRAIELNPNYALAYHRYAHLLLTLGRFDEALAKLRQAQELDPFFPRAVNARVSFLYFARRYDEAIGEARAIVSETPTATEVERFLGLALLANGQIAEGVQILQSNPMAMRFGDVAYAYALADRTQEAEEQLARTIAAQPSYTYVPAMILVALGRHEEALGWLDRALREGSSAMVLLKVDPRLDPLRREPRFSKLLAAMNLPADSQPEGPIQQSVVEPATG